ncbi:hypothetical protein [Polyangium aurulentum]|uniref:hypothetical protein n=1 Tax=Polyangium aurulentum TaxID=2567896 RepID=UPI0010AE8B86|nr:hypothetical protein [Polyangium aurulentum]UQA62700.1 hypothetical protein E8A73_020485 [Polyangium aurulentum]
MRSSKPSTFTLFAARTLALAALLVPAVAFADEVGPNEESCVQKKSGDACADAKGAPGTCAAATDPYGHERVRCVAGAAAPASSAASAPKPEVKKAGGCNVSMPLSDAEGAAPIAAGLACAALGLAASRRRARSSRR